MVFPVVMYGCKSWTVKKAECQRIDAFELWCWRTVVFRVPWTARRSNNSILKEIRPEYSLEGLLLKLQYFGHLMRRTASLEKTLMLERLKAGGEGDDRRWDGWVASPTQWTWVWVNSRSWLWTGSPGVLQSMGLQRVRHTWAFELNWFYFMFMMYLKHIVTIFVLEKRNPGCSFRKLNHGSNFQLWQAERNSVCLVYYYEWIDKVKFQFLSLQYAI